MEEPKFITQIRNFLNRNGLMLISLLVMIMFFRGCGVNSDIEQLQQKVDSLQVENQKLKDIRFLTTKEYKEDMDKRVLNILQYERMLDEQQIDMKQIRHKMNVDE